MSAKELKGVYNLNPTSMVMKQGSEAERRERSKGGKEYVGGKNPRMPEAHEAPVDTGVEAEAHSHDNPAMKTRHSHPSEKKHSDGRKHEDHHWAVKQLKG
jgi:hypothetical protein